MTRHAGFDIGGTNARLGLYDGSWNSLGSARRRIRDTAEPAALLEVMRELFEELEVDEIDTVGVGIAGQLADDGERVVNAPNLGWRDVRFAHDVREAFDARVRLVNDLSAQVIGERHSGAARGFDHVLAAFVGTGFGGAILNEGELVRGSGGKAGEIGHTKVVVNGRLCGCGQRGCVEAYVSGVHLERQVADLGLEAFEGAEEIDLGRADALAAAGEGPLMSLWEEATDMLAVTLANSVTLLNPSLLLLGGGVLDNLEYFRSETLAKFHPQVLEAAHTDLEVRFASLGDSAGVLGAAILARG